MSISPASIAYDPESAKALLAEAGYPDGFEFTLDTPDYDPHPIVAQFLQSELAKIGVTVNINIITANEWYTKIYQEQDFEATLQEHVNHRDIVFYGNPDFYWGYNNPEVVELIATAEASATVEEQVEKLTEANQHHRRRRGQQLALSLSADRGIDRQRHRLSGQRPELSVLRLRHQEEPSSNTEHLTRSRRGPDS